MTAALFCPGPSLARLDAPPACEFSVAVNRAGTRFAASAWAALDYPTIRDWQDAVIGDPLLLTRRQTWLDIRRRCRLSRVRLVEELDCPVPHWSDKTATAALVLLGAMGATRVDVYGADMAADAPDFDGFTQKGSDRGAKRWADERAAWDGLTAWLAGRGCAVNRVTPNGASNV